jgi:hypothetical protein
MRIVYRRSEYETVGLLCFRDKFIYLVIGKNAACFRALPAADAVSDNVSSHLKYFMGNAFFFQLLSNFRQRGVCIAVWLCAAV